MNIYVGGANGVGKSTILRRAAQIDKRLEIIHLASGIMQQLGIAPGNYDALRATSRAVQDSATTAMIDALTARQTHKVRLIDGHYSYLVAGAFRPATAAWIDQFDALVLVTADTKIIWHRVQADEVLRDRDLFSSTADEAIKKAELTAFIENNRFEFELLSKKHQKDHFILTHNDDNVDRAAQQLINFINSITT